MSSGIDMALTLAARIAGDDFAQAVQLGIEYDPQPPFDAGSVDKAPDHIVELLVNMYADRSIATGVTITAPLRSAAPRRGSATSAR